MNRDVEACVDGKKLVVTRPDGKRYKMTTIRHSS